MERDETGEDTKHDFSKIKWHQTDVGTYNQTVEILEKKSFLHEKCHSNLKKRPSPITKKYQTFLMIIFYFIHKV